MINCRFEEFWVSHCVFFAGGRVDGVCDVADSIAQIPFLDTGKIPRYAIGLHPANLVAAILVHGRVFIEISRMSQAGIEPVQSNRVSRQCFSQVFDCPVQGLTVFPGYFYGKMV